MVIRIDGMKFKLAYFNGRWILKDVKTLKKVATFPPFTKRYDMEEMLEFAPFLIERYGLLK